MRQIFRQFWPHIVCTIVALALWDTPFVKPFRVFTVQVHEMWHAAAALTTGGDVTEIRTHWNESGYTSSRGGSVPIISSAGYVGSAFLGAFLIYAGSWALFQRLLLAGIGTVSIWMAVRYTPLWGLDFGFAILSGAALLAVAGWSRRVSEAGAIWVGVMLCLYSLYDFRTDLWMIPERTDAGILARHWGLPFLAYPIAFVWAAVSIFAMYRALRSAYRRRAASDVSETRPKPPESS